jgi:hypothetical protein
MTTIVIDRLNKRLYTDSRVTITPKATKIFGKVIYRKGEESIRDDWCKVMYSTRNRIITGSGNVALIQKYRDYLLGKRKFCPKLVDTTVYDITFAPTFKVICNDDGKIHECTGDFHVTGSGADYACGAIVARPFAESKDKVTTAIKAAIKLDKYSGGDIVEYDLSGRWYDEDKC